MNGLNRCVTCSVSRHWTDGHASHFISRRHLATRWRPENVHFSCVKCNTYLHGNLINYTLYMQKTYGQSVIDELMRLKQTTVKLDRETLEEMIKQYE